MLLKNIIAETIFPVRQILNNYVMSIQVILRCKLHPWMTAQMYPRLNLMIWKAPARMSLNNYRYPLVS